MFSDDDSCKRSASEHGATSLLPIGESLLGRAFAHEIAIPKRLLVMSAYITEPDNIVPAALNVDRFALEPTLVDQWPQMYAPLGPYLANTVVIPNGCGNFIGGHQHRAGTSALSCIDPIGATPEDLSAPPGGPTIDQFIAGSLSAGAPHKSVLWGLSGDAIRDERQSASGVFASGPNAKLQHFVDPWAMQEYLFAGQSGSDSGLGLNGFRPLRDVLVSDLAVLRGALAPEERAGLDSYEQAIVEFDARQEALAAVDCGSGDGQAIAGDAQSYLEWMADQSALRRSRVA